MGVSKAKGFLLANNLKKKSRKVVVLTGDGELQEGQFGVTNKHTKEYFKKFNNYN